MSSASAFGTPRRIAPRAKLFILQNCASLAIARTAAASSTTPQSSKLTRNVFNSSAYKSKLPCITGALLSIFIPYQLPEYCGGAINGEGVNPNDGGAGHIEAVDIDAGGGFPTNP
ncbi:hypothetical protein PR002_g23644 [Phytophthora rubi]|uniref:Uncharacterized protein n=1 Tax=Phytophthora rubi TaxID=129364 RepID=A0A6A3IPI6_9STRA|nr:hypothetical protein PR002_g23644 [Phytophthora rubi]